MLQIQFKDFITLQRGFDLPKRKRKPGKYPLVASTKIDGSHNEYKVQGPGVVTGRSGSLGGVQYIDNNYWPLNTTLWVKDFKSNQPRYVYYFLQTLNLAQYNSGAGVPTLNRNHLDTMQIEVHQPKKQEEIANALASYDVLIENNNRRIAILEEMAQSLYREWFVKFRFPGHENTKLVDSPLGKIPEGWEVMSLSELMDIRGGSQPPKKEWIDDAQEGYVRMLQIRDYQKDSYIAYVKDSKKLRKTTKEEIMIARYGASVARIMYGLEGAYNVAIAKVIEKKKNTREFLRWFLKDDYFQKTLIGMSGRAAQNGFNKGDIAAIHLSYPKISSLVDAFESIANPILKHILVIRHKNVNLSAQRDLLLPKLISGNINL